MRSPLHPPAAAGGGSTASRRRPRRSSFLFRRRPSGEVRPWLHAIGVAIGEGPRRTPLPRPTAGTAGLQAGARRDESEAAGRGRSSRCGATRSIAEDVAGRGHRRVQAWLRSGSRRLMRRSRRREVQGPRWRGRCRRHGHGLLDVDAVQESWAGPAVHRAWQGRRRDGQVWVVDDHVIAGRLHLLISVQKRRRRTSENPCQQRLRFRHHWRSWGGGLGA
jgi:hypothetical protein